MVKPWWGICVLIVGFGMSCTPEQEEFTYDASARLRFSNDSIKFDTIFTSVGSITRRLRIYNDSDNAVNIAGISLEKKETSPYTIYVNGRAGPAFQDVRILGKDSLLILVEVTIDPKNEDLPFLVTDNIRFTTNGNLQEVKLVSWGQDAVFINGEVICDTHWSADRPYVITNSVLIDSLCTLTVDAGTKVYSHNGSFILIEGTIEVNGTADERVLFRNDRLEGAYENAPGQWGGLVFLPGSKGNSIQYADIRNAEFGAYLGTPDDDNEPDLVIGHSRIENIGGTETFTGNLININPGYGVLAVTSDLYMYNTLINNCAIHAVGNFAGGNYKYEHCTFANYSFDFFREDPTVVIADNIDLGEELLVSEVSAELTNCIIWGNLQNELLISNGGGADFELSMVSNLIKTTNSEYDINGNILNEGPLFFDAVGYDYTLDTLSPAMNAGVLTDITTDLEGKQRDEQPDIGAYERNEN